MTIRQGFVATVTGLEPSFCDCCIDLGVTMGSARLPHADIVLFMVIEMKTTIMMPSWLVATEVMTKGSSKQRLLVGSISTDHRRRRRHRPPFYRSALPTLVL